MMTNNRLAKRKYGGIQADFRIKERKNKFISAGLEAFGTIGYSKTSIKKLCNLSELTERYFYESFKSKEDLLITVYQNVTDDLLQNARAIITTDTPLTKKTYRALKLYYETIQSDPRKARIMFFEILGVSPKVDKAYQTAIRELSAISMEFISPTPDNLNPAKNTILPSAVAGAIIQVAHEWMLNSFDPPLETILSQFMVLFKSFQSIFPNDS